MKIEGEKIWVDFRVERLPRFCYVCGCLGHNMQECHDFDEDIPESELPYGTCLQASPIKMRDKGPNPKRDLENKLFLDL
ncbi:Collagen alpha-1(I) chain [Bienertia sinuspersici]